MSYLIVYIQFVINDEKWFLLDLRSCSIEKRSFAAGGCVSCTVSQDFRPPPQFPPGGAKILGNSPPFRKFAPL